MEYYELKFKENLLIDIKKFLIIYWWIFSWKFDAIIDSVLMVTKIINIVIIRETYHLKFNLIFQKDVDLIILVSKILIYIFMYNNKICKKTKLHQIEHLLECSNI